MWYRLAQINVKHAAAEWTLGMTLVIVIGVLAILLLVVLAMSRRWVGRQHKAIETDKAQRRPRGQVDVWGAGSDRYVDHDKLPDELPDEHLDETDSAYEGYAEEADERATQDTRPGIGIEEEDEPPYEDDQEEQDDPYGLFRDTPYEDPDDDDDFDEREEGFGDDERGW